MPTWSRRRVRRSPTCSSSTARPTSAGWNGRPSPPRCPNTTGVVALGGGAVLDDETRKDLAAHHVVFLDVSLPDAVRRVGLAASRPLLLGNVRGRLKQLMDARRPLYAEVATAVVTTDGREPADIAAEVVGKL